MAKLPALIETLGHFHPQHDAASIRYAARALREADLLSAGAGGRGAPHMTVRDAVHLLLALNLAPTPSQYANAARLASALSWSADTLADFGEGPEVIYTVISAETLGEALEDLIQRAEELCPPRARDPFGGQGPGRRPDEGPTVEVEMVQHDENILARVAMEWRGAGRPRRAERQYGVRAAKLGYGRWTTVHFDQALFLALKRTVVAAPPWAFAAEPARR